MQTFFDPRKVGGPPDDSNLHTIRISITCKAVSRLWLINLDAMLQRSPVEGGKSPYPKKYYTIQSTPYILWVYPPYPLDFLHPGGDLQIINNNIIFLSFRFLYAKENLLKKILYLFFLDPTNLVYLDTCWFILQYPLLILSCPRQPLLPAHQEIINHPYFVVP